MGSIADFVNALNADVVDSLATGEYPLLTDGAILFGRASVFQQSAPPRIIVSPVEFAFGAPDIYSKSSTLGTDERREQNVMLAIHSERFVFEIRCWGGTQPGSGVENYDLTRALYHCVLASLQRLVPNHGLEGKGSFTEAGAIGALGEEAVFRTWIDMPVLDRMLPYDNATQYAPAAVAPVVTDTFVAATGETGTGC